MRLALRLWALREERPLFVVVATATAVTLLAWPLADRALRLAGVAPRFGFWDFGVYAAAVNRWWAGGPLYVPGESGGYHGAFLYPPVAVALFAPFAALPLGLQRPAWLAASVATLWVGLQALVGVLGYDLRGYERLLLLWGAVGFQPVLFALKMGQTPGVLVGAVCLAFAAAEARGGSEEERDRRPRNRHLDRALAWLAAAPVALVGVVKLVYAPVGTPLLRDRRRLARAVAVGLAALAVSLAVFGVETHRAYLDVLRWGMASGGDARDPRVWMPAYFRPLYGVPGRTLVRVGAAGGLATLALAAESPARREAFAAGVAAVPLLAPKTYTYYLVALLPAALVLLAGELERPDGRPALVPVGVLLAHWHAYGLLAVGSLVPDWIPPSPAFAPVLAVIQPGLWGAVLLAGLATVRLAERVPADPFFRLRPNG